MPGTANFHEPIADALLPQAAGVVDDAAALDAAVDGLDTHAPARDAPIRHCLRAREGPAPRLPRRHDEVDPVERNRQAAAILESSAACRQGVGGGLRHPLSGGAAGRGLTETEEREGCLDQQDVCDRVARFLAAITARLRNGSLGARAAPLGPLVPNRGEAGVETGAAAGGPDVLGSSSVGTTSALASAAVTPRRCASAVTDRVGASPSARSVARRTTTSP
jgi:hypothetical protein